MSSRDALWFSKTSLTSSISTLQPFQQVILFFLFVIGDFTFVSWFMVLVRKRFFRRHCEKLLLRSNNLRPSRTKTIFDKAFTPSSQAIRRKPCSEGPISGPTNARPVDDFVTERVESPTAMQEDERESTSVREEVESPVQMEDARSSPVNGKSGSTTAQSSVREPYVQSGLTVTPNTHEPERYSPRGLSISQARTIQINEPSPVTARQHLRARSRGMSLAAPSERLTLKRQATMTTTRIHNIPAPSHPKTTGMGGFPTPIQLFHQLIPSDTKSTLRQRLSKPERQYTLLTGPSGIMQQNDPEAGSDGSWGNVKATVARWMPEKLGGLVIGRNSRFFTEELDDEELEQLGGVEYRALRLLSYLVPAVSDALA